MQLERKDARTGLLVLAAVTLVFSALIGVALSGALNPEKTCQIYLHDASGLNAGAPVFLAGRAVGHVSAVFTPVPQSQRPAADPNAEALVEVRIARSAKLYRDAQAQLLQHGILGQLVIDFVQGSEASGLATGGDRFVGTSGLSFNDSLVLASTQLAPVAASTTLLLTDLRRLANDVETLLGPRGPLVDRLDLARGITHALGEVTGPSGALTGALRHAEILTTAQRDPEGPFQKGLRRIQATSGEGLFEGRRIEEQLTRAQATSQQAARLLGQVEGRLQRLEPSLQSSGEQTVRLTETAKRQPWRLLRGAAAPSAPRSARPAPPER